VIPLETMVSSPGWLRCDGILIKAVDQFDHHGNGGTGAPRFLVFLPWTLLPSAHMYVAHLGVPRLQGATVGSS